MIRVIRNKLLEEKICVIVSILTLATSFFVKPNLAAIDLKVIAALFNLMLIALALEKHSFLDYIALKLLNRCHSEKQLGYALIGITAVLSMILTNDVALLTMVPLTLLMGKILGRAPLRLVALETVAANVGSSLTPFGNPQNLYLYATYHIPTLAFFSTLGPFVIGGLLYLFLLVRKLPDTKRAIHMTPVIIKNPVKITVYALLLLLAIASILRMIPYILATALIVIVCFLFDRELFLNVDYYLLGTFVGFFLLIDNITRLPFFVSWVTKQTLREGDLFVLAMLLSQVISNVPAAVALSGVSESYAPVLLGVSIGGMGTLIASMANLIAYKLYAKQHEGRPYLNYFYKINLMGLLILGILAFLLFTF
ncbi:MAG: anion transporter [Clostridia bacterium]|nr:anion transporter [Clostridia bacterium]